MLDNLTTHEIEMMDKVLQSEYTDKQESKKTTIEQLAKFYRTSPEQIEFAFQNIGDFMDNSEQPICTIQRFSSGKVAIVKFNPILYKKYKEEGGFKTYFERNRNLKYVVKPPTTAAKIIIEILIGLLVGLTITMVTIWLTKKLP